MKRTSINANILAEKNFKESHRQRILFALTEPLTSIGLSAKTGLDQVGVSRRMSELESQGLVVVVGVDNGFSIYKKIDVKCLEESFKKQSAEKKTKRILKALINDDEAFRQIAIVFLNSKLKSYTAIDFTNQIHKMIKNKIK